MAAEIPNSVVGDLQQLQAAVAELHNDLRQVQQNQAEMLRILRRFDSRISDTKADLITLLKLETIGATANLEGRLELRFDRLEQLLTDQRM